MLATSSISGKPKEIKVTAIEFYTESMEADTTDRANDECIDIRVKAFDEEWYTLQRSVEWYLEKKNGPNQLILSEIYVKN